MWSILDTLLWHSNKKYQKTQDVTLFDNTDICNIRLTLNSEYYPAENMKLDFSSRKYQETCYIYTRETIRSYQ